MTDELYDQYKNDKSFKTYVETYCRSRGLGPFEALSHITVKEVAKYYRNKDRDVIESAGQQDK